MQLVKEPFTQTAPPFFYYTFVRIFYYIIIVFWYWIDLGVGWCSRLKYRYQIGSEHVVSDSPKVDVQFVSTSSWCDWEKPKLLYKTLLSSALLSALQISHLHYFCCSTFKHFAVTRVPWKVLLVFGSFSKSSWKSHLVYWNWKKNKKKKTGATLLNF